MGDLAMPDERRQFKILYRDFLSRMVDLELVSAGGDAQGLIARIGSLLAALSFILAYLIVPRYATSGHSHARLARLAWDDEEFLISATITVAGLCAVMAWNTVFPDRRDSLILGLIPVRVRTMILARAAAIATVLGAVVGALNVFTGVSFPFALSSGFVEGLRAFLAWWLVLAAAGVFTFCAGLVLQGLAAQLLPWRFFLRISGVLQIAALGAVLSGLFLTPPFDAADPPPYIPSFWFVGLLHELRGDGSLLFEKLATRALAGLASAVLLSTLLYVLSWSRNVRRMVESPDILSAKHARLTSVLAKFWSPAPFGRAILLFTARTIARSRQHRLMLAIYGGFAFALSLAFSASLPGASHQEWSRPNGAFLLAGFLLMACAVIGIRTIFALPATLPANWIFRITAVHRPADYFSAVRKSLYTFSALPVWLGTAVCYLAIWPGQPALEQILVLGLLGIVIVERSLYQFRKIPFACSWLPGNAHGKMKTGIWCCVFLMFATMAGAIELWSMEKGARIIVVFAILGALAVRARYRTSEFAAEPENRLQFEDLPPADIYALDLRQDGAWSGDEAYVEAIDPNMGRSLQARAMPFAIGAVLLLLSGFLYEQAGEWKDRRDFPQIGRSVDIGGRSLNIYCSGTGSPTVVFDSRELRPGYSWFLAQRQAATFTRACWYDRAGYGWSDPADGARTGADMARDLHNLLHRGGVTPPYLLVGQSSAGFNVRIYAHRYPGEVAGLVIVDPADESSDPDRIPFSLLSSLWDYFPRSVWGAATGLCKALGKLGLARLFDSGTGSTYGGWNGRDTAIIHALQVQAKSVDAYTREGVDREQTLAELKAAGGLGTLPLVVIARRGIPSESLSSRETVVAVGKGIWDIPSEAPMAVVEAVRTVLKETGSN